MAVAAIALILPWAVLTIAVAGEGPADDPSAEQARESRLLESVRYLATDKLEGRGVGTHGLDLAADYIAVEFSAIGLKTDAVGGGAFQTFTMTTGAQLGETNRLSLIGPPAEGASEARQFAWNLGADFNPFALGGSGAIDLPLVFVGYGITAPDANYDDYAGLDVTGKAVVVLRHEPEQTNPHSAFNGTDHSPHAPFSRKVSNAFEHGAAAVVFCTDSFEIQQKVGQRQAIWQKSLGDLAAANEAFKGIAEPSLEQIAVHRLEVEKLLDVVRDEGQKMAAEMDPVLDFRSGGINTDASRITVLHCRRQLLDAAVKECLGADLAALEREIDNGPTPHSGELAGWRLTGEINVIRQESQVKNVVGVLEGEGPLANETVLIGAHYDHLGFGGESSLEPGSTAVHNGADDNASGTAALVEVARILSAREARLPRRVVFVAFTAEEKGLIGSARYCREPVVPLDQTIAMLNMDMVGRLADDKLIIQGVDTATQFGPLIDRLNEKYGFQITRQSGGFGPSDHASFYAQNVPVMHFFTGTHPDYHRPTDDADKINAPGMRRVAEMVAQTAVELAMAEARPEYLAVVSSQTAGGGGDRPYFGSIPDFAQTDPGYAISGVTKEGPAEKAGLAGGDIIIRFGDSQIGNLEDFDSALRKYKAGDKVPVVVKRGGEERVFEVVLDPPR